MPIKTDKPNLESFIRKTDAGMPEAMEPDIDQKGKRFLLRSPFGLWYELEADTPREGLPVIKVSFLWDKRDANIPYFSDVFRVVERVYDLQLGVLAAIIEQARGLQAYWSGLFGSMTELMKPFVAFQSGSGGAGRYNPVSQTMVKEPPAPTKTSPAPSETPQFVKRRGSTSDLKRSERGKKSPNRP